ncbi:hypothetical protein D3C85_1716220 [compost metagenome]
MPTMSAVRNTTTTSTTMVSVKTVCRLGQLIFLNSARTSAKNCCAPLRGPKPKAIPPPFRERALSRSSCSCSAAGSS